MNLFCNSLKFVHAQEKVLKWSKIKQQKLQNEHEEKQMKITYFIC